MNYRQNYSVNNMNSIIDKITSNYFVDNVLFSQIKLSKE